MLTSCSSHSLDNNGRIGIGVSQENAESDYPLISPSEDISHLIADMHISLEQESALRPPFHIHWLSGFGCDAPEGAVPEYDISSSSWSSLCDVSSSSSETYNVCAPLPTHTHDIIIKDSQDTIVFDSTKENITYTARDWGDRLKVVNWRHPYNAVLTVVYHTKWAEDGNPEPKYYSNYFFPDSAIIDDRAIDRVPERIKSINVLLDTFRKTPVLLEAGYNLQVDVENIVRGNRNINRLVFHAVPGAGYGLFPDCTTGPSNIQTINGISPTDHGDFYLSAQECYWQRQPTRLITTEPRVTLPEIDLTPGSVPTANLPHVNAGSAKNLPGWPTDDSPTYAHLQIGNDCAACCDCEDYENVGVYMAETRDSYKDLGTDASNIRDQYHENRKRWLTAYDCNRQKPLRVSLTPQICPFIDVSIQYCNQTDECQTEIELTVDLSTHPEGYTGNIVSGYTFARGVEYLPGRKVPRLTRYEVYGAWPTYSAFFDKVEPRQSISARFRLRFDDCGIAGYRWAASLGSSLSSAELEELGATAIAITGSLHGKIKGESIRIPKPYDPTQYIPAVTTFTQTLNCPSNSTNTVDLTDCICYE